MTQSASVPFLGATLSGYGSNGE